MDGYAVTAMQKSATIPPCMVADYATSIFAALVKLREQLLFAATGCRAFARTLVAGRAAHAHLRWTRWLTCMGVEFAMSTCAKGAMV